MGNHLSFGAEGTHEAEILQSPSTKDEAKAAGGYKPTVNSFAKVLYRPICVTTVTIENLLYS